MSIHVLLIFASLIWTHFLADFLLQSHEMSCNKSKSNFWLGLHCYVYILPFLWVGVQFAIITGLLHFLVDYGTSRATSRLWQAQETHWFFVVIGFDQAAHLTFLLGTYALLAA